MAYSFIKAISEISKVTGGMMSNFEVMQPEEYFAIRHSFKPTIIVPYMAIKNNIAFLLTEGNKKVITTDRVRCIATDIKEVHICDLESDIEQLYHLSAWNFIKRWKMNESNLGSMYFVKMNLEKIDNE